jgi:hypothetical protein
LFFTIGDVSGKGIAAALFMMKTVTLLRMEPLRDISPHEILMRVNNQLCHNNDYGMFVAVLCGILDLAGHTREQAADLIGVERCTWQDWDRGIAQLPSGMLRLYRHLAGIERIPFRSV